MTRRFPWRWITRKNVNLHCKLFGHRVCLPGGSKAPEEERRRPREWDDPILYCSRCGVEDGFEGKETDCEISTWGILPWCWVHVESCWYDDVWWKPLGWRPALRRVWFRHHPQKAWQMLASPCRDGSVLLSRSLPGGRVQYATVEPLWLSMNVWPMTINHEPCTLREYHENEVWRRDQMTWEESESAEVQRSQCEPCE